MATIRKASNPSRRVMTNACSMIWVSLKLRFGLKRLPHAAGGSQVGSTQEESLSCADGGGGAEIRRQQRGRRRQAQVRGTARDGDARAGIRRGRGRLGDGRYDRRS